MRGMGSPLFGGCDAMGPEQDGAAGLLGGALDDADAASLELPHHAGVVDERTERVNGSHAVLRRLPRHVKGAIDAVAGARLVGD